MFGMPGRSCSGNVKRVRFIQFTDCGAMQELTSSLVLGDFVHVYSIFG